MHVLRKNYVLGKNYMSRVSSLVSKICFTWFINVVFLNKILIPLNHVTTKIL